MARPHQEAQSPLNWGYLLFLTLVAAFGGLLFGYHTAVISGALVFLQVDLGLRPAVTGWLIASPLLGAALGAGLAGVFSFRFGRRLALLVAAVLFLVAAVGSALAESLFSLVAYRVIGGIGVGVASIVSPLYVAEIAPANRRGRMVSTIQLAIVAGVLLTYFVNYAIASSGTAEWNLTNGWRWMFASQVIPSLCLLVLAFFAPESPRWLIRWNRQAEACHVLTKMGGRPFADAEVARITSAIRDSRECPKHVYTRGLRRLIWIGVGIAVFQQVTGINVFIYFAPVIFERAAGASTDIALLQTIVLGIANLVFTVVAAFTVDHIGRKPLMVIGFAGMTICLTAVAVALYNEHLDADLLIFLVGYIAFFAVSVGPITWVLLSEMFPARIRGVAMGVATMANWLSNFVITQTFPIMERNDWLVDQFGHSFPFFLYAAFGVLAVFFIVRFIPETKGHSLESIEAMLRGWQRQEPQPA